MRVKGLVKGFIGQLPLQGDYYAKIIIHKEWYGLCTKKNYKSQRTARAAAERLAKKLNLEITWEE